MFKLNPPPQVAGFYWLKDEKPIKIGKPPKLKFQAAYKPIIQQLSLSFMMFLLRNRLS